MYTHICFSKLTFIDFQKNHLNLFLHFALKGPEGKPGKIGERGKQGSKVLLLLFYLLLLLLINIFGFKKLIKNSEFTRISLQGINCDLLFCNPCQGCQRSSRSPW